MAVRNTSQDMGTVYHARPCGKLIEINSSLRRKNVSCTNIQCLSSNFIKCKFFLESSSLILALCGANLDHSIHFSNFSVRLSSFNLKGFSYCYEWSCSLCMEGTFFCTGLIFRKFLFVFSTGFHSFDVLLLFPLLINVFIFVRNFWCYFV